MLLTIIHWVEEEITLWHLIILVVVVDVLSTIFNPTLSASLSVYDLEYVLCPDATPLDQFGFKQLY